MPGPTAKPHPNTMKNSGSAATNGALPRQGNTSRRRRRAEHQGPEQNRARPALRNVVVPLELPAAGHALLKAMAIQAECASVEEFIRDAVLSECRFFAEALADKHSPDLEELLTVNPKEAARL